MTRAPQGAYTNLGKLMRATDLDTFLASSTFIPESREAFLLAFWHLNPRLKGATVGDVLEILDDRDANLPEVEAFCAANPDAPEHARHAVRVALWMLLAIAPGGPNLSSIFHVTRSLLGLPQPAEALSYILLLICIWLVDNPWPCGMLVLVSEDLTPLARSRPCPPSLPPPSPPPSPLATAPRSPR